MCNIKNNYIKFKKYIIKSEILILLFSIIGSLSFKNNNIVNALNMKEDKKIVVKINEKIPSLISPSNGVVTSNFGTRKGGKHHGIDIASKIGTPIKASCKGVVVKVDYHEIYGKRIIINHGSSIETLYAHCSSIFVKEGQKVYSGQHIANIGNTGKSTGPHIHFELRMNGEAINPSNYIK